MSVQICCQAVTNCVLTDVSVSEPVQLPANYKKCTGCGECIIACPKKIIKLIPYNAKHWVGCSNTDKASNTNNYCNIGCIGCKACENSCPYGAIQVKENHAVIDFSKCTGCGICQSECPRKIIWSARSQSEDGIIRLKQDLSVDNM